MKRNKSKGKMYLVTDEPLQLAYVDPEQLAEEKRRRDEWWERFLTELTKDIRDDIADIGQRDNAE